MSPIDEIKWAVLIFFIASIIYFFYNMMKEDKK